MRTSGWILSVFHLSLHLQAHQSPVSSQRVYVVGHLMHLKSHTVIVTKVIVGTWPDGDKMCYFFVNKALFLLNQLLHWEIIDVPMNGGGLQEVWNEEVCWTLVMLEREPFSTCCLSLRSYGADCTDLLKRTPVAAQVHTNTQPFWSPQHWFLLSISVTFLKC